MAIFDQIYPKIIVLTFSFNLCKHENNQFIPSRVCSRHWNSFLTISNENIFFKTQGTRLGAIVARNKSLE